MRRTAWHPVLWLLSGASGLITLLKFYQQDLAVVGKSLNFARSYLFHLKNADGNSLTHKIFMNFTWANACTACLEPGKTQELLTDIFLLVMRMLNARSLCTSNWCLPRCTSETIFSLWVFSFLRGCPSGDVPTSFHCSCVNASVEAQTLLILLPSDLTANGSCEFSGCSWM